MLGYMSITTETDPGRLVHVSADAYPMWGNLRPANFANLLSSQSAVGSGCWAKPD